MSRLELKGEDPTGEVIGGYLKLRGPYSASTIRKSEEYEWMWVLDIKGQVFLDINDGEDTSVVSMVHLLNICTDQSATHKDQRTKSLILKYDELAGNNTRIGLFSHMDFSSEPWEIRDVVIV